MMISVNITASHAHHHHHDESESAAAAAAIASSTKTTEKAALWQMDLASPSTTSVQPKLQEYSARTEQFLSSTAKAPKLKLRRQTSDDSSPVAPSRRMSVFQDAPIEIDAERITKKKPHRRIRSSNDLVGMVINANNRNNGDSSDDDNVSKISIGGVSTIKPQATGLAAVNAMRRSRSAGDLLSLMPMGRMPSSNRSTVSPVPRQQPQKTPQRARTLKDCDSDSDDEDNEVHSDGSGIFTNGRGKRRRERKRVPVAGVAKDHQRRAPMRRNRSASDLRSACTAPTDGDNRRSASLSRSIIPRSNKKVAALSPPPQRSTNDDCTTMPPPNTNTSDGNTTAKGHRRRGSTGNSSAKSMVDIKYESFMDASASDLFGGGLRDRPSCQPRRARSPGAKGTNCRPRRARSSGPSFVSLSNNVNSGFVSKFKHASSSTITEPTLYDADPFQDDNNQADDDDDDSSMSSSSSSRLEEEDEEIVNLIRRSTSHSKLMAMDDASYLTAPPVVQRHQHQHQQLLVAAVPVNAAAVAPVVNTKPWNCACGEENEADCNFCGMCAKPKKWTCVSCSFGNNKCRAIFCGGCAAPKEVAVAI